MAQTLPFPTSARETGITAWNAQPESASPQAQDPIQGPLGLCESQVETTRQGILHPRPKATGKTHSSCPQEHSSHSGLEGSPVQVPGA